MTSGDWCRQSFSGSERSYRTATAKATATAGTRMYGNGTDNAPISETAPRAYSSAPFAYPCWFGVFRVIRVLAVAVALVPRNRNSNSNSRNTDVRKRHRQRTDKRNGAESIFLGAVCLSVLVPCIRCHPCSGPCSCSCISQPQKQPQKPEHGCTETAQTTHR
jgi:hypothetical protein